MSRIGKRPIPLPKGVTVIVKDGFFEVKGPKGSVKRKFPAELTFEVKDGEGLVGVGAGASVDALRPFHGTARALIASAVQGVSVGFKATLKLEGTGYKAERKGQMLNLSLGLSHPVNYELPREVSANIPPESKGTIIQLEAFDKEILGQAIAKLQSFRPPEPYKAKGVQLEGQKIRRKAGKAGGKGGKGGK